MMPAAKNCAGCGRVYPRPRKCANGNWKTRRYCSVTCANRDRSVGLEKTATPAPRCAQTWMRYAPCRGQPQDFVPDTHGTAQPAIRFCVEHRCLFAAPCLAYGQATKAHGVWGGRYLEFGKITTSSRHGASR